MKCFEKLQFFCLFIFLIGFCKITYAQQSSQKYVRQTDYLLSLPDGYNTDTTKKWPLLLFLHGSGERGDDVEKIKVNGPPKLVANGKKFPFIIVSPQAKEDEDGWETENLYHFLGYLKHAFRIDVDRIYLTGLSMGGFATWTLAINHPEEFAAIIPICGGGDTAMAWRLRYTPVWCFHGALDNVVPVAKDEQMVNALRKYNSNVRFTVYPGVYHNSWEKAYDNDSIYTWLLAQKKFRYKETKSVPKMENEYAGIFVDDGGDTISLYIDTAGLHAKTHEDDYLLKQGGKNDFFISEDLLADIKFLRNKKGTYDSFIFFADKKYIFKRILIK